MRTIAAAILLATLSGCVWHGCGRRTDWVWVSPIASFNDQFRYDCSIEPKRNVNRCTIRENKTYKVLCERDFRIQPDNRYATLEDLGLLVSFDGENLRVRNGSGREVTLSPLMPCKAED